MSEKLKMRREADRANAENNEKYQALKELHRFGLLRSIKNVKLYHGRTNLDGGIWEVQPDYDNSGNKTGNNNIHKIPILNTARDTNVAKAYAMHRSNRDGGKPEYHRIVSDDPDANVLDTSFNTKGLSQFELNELKGAIRKTLPPSITYAVPLDFDERESLKNKHPNNFIVSGRSGFTYREDMAKNAQKFQLEPELNRKMVSARNTMMLISEHPHLISKLVLAYTDNRHEISFEENGERHAIPISHDYLKSWFRETHTIGCRFNNLISPHINQKYEGIQLFDLEKIHTTNETERREKRIERRFGKIALETEQRGSKSKLMDSLKQNLYIKPQEIVALAKKTPGYKEVFEADAGNWEKFTLGEHTETVLRLFDDNYADKLPASMLPLMRMALLVHDVGKPQAAKENNKREQKGYNTFFANDFLSKNNVSAMDRWLILRMIGDGSELTSRWMVKREKGMRHELYDYCEETMQCYLGEKTKVDSGTVMGFLNMLMVLQTCDSAAYTTMAVTRSEKNRVYHRNYGSFNRSFENYKGFTGKRAKMKSRH